MCNFVQNVDPFINRRVAGGITHPKMTVAAAKGHPGDDEQVVTHGFRHELASSAPRCLGKQIESSAGLYKLEPATKSLDDAITLFPVACSEWRSVEIPGRDAGML